jgi:uncharacterized hydrophobic protein (TIGR00271 family)
MLAVDSDQLRHMRDAVFFDGPDASHKLSRFCVLLVLAGIIASAGVVADSTATVIGAMIVAPLMIPIQGTMLALVLSDRPNVIRSVALTVGAAATAVAIGFVIAALVPNDVVAATNSQVAARVNPTLLDLVAALATGAVGSIALVRQDISDTLPGVAIAISLVPPLAVVGIALEGGEPGQSWGALLLFLTNVTAILAVGSVVMALYRVRAVAARPANGSATTRRRNRSPIVIAMMLALIAVPLTTSSVLLIRQRDREDEVLDASRAWARERDWEVLGVTTMEGKTVVRLAGPLPLPDPASLRDAIAASGIDVSAVRAEFHPSQSVDFGDTDRLAAATSWGG